MAPAHSVAQLSGLLQKRSQWLGRWRPRQVVLCGDHLDYFLPGAAPGAAPRGSIGLVPGGAVVTEEPGHPFCIRAGGEVLSCSSAEEQKRWLEAANAAFEEQPLVRLLQLAAPVGGTVAVAARSSAASAAGPYEPPLVIISPDGIARALAWHDPVTLRFTNADGAAAIIIIGGPEKQVYARLALADVGTGAKEVPLELQDADGLHQKCSGADSRVAGKVMHIQILANTAAWPHHAVICGLCAILHMWMFATDCLTLASLLLSLLPLLLLLVSWRGHREVTISAEALAPAATAAAAPSAPPPRPISSSPKGAARPKDRERQPPLALRGRWELDRADSESPEPLLAALGVPWVARKAAAAANVVLDLDVTQTHVILSVKTPVKTMVDQLPLDGTAVRSPGMPGSNASEPVMRRLAHCSGLSLEMRAELGSDGKRTVDTLELLADGRMARTSRFGSVTVTRRFRRAPA